MAYRVNGQLAPVGGGDPIPLIRETMTVGRLESCDICMKTSNVSKEHCRFTFHNGFWVLEDLNSTNGVKVNGVRVTKKLLRADDAVSIAKREYKIEYEEPVGVEPPEDVMEEDPLAQSLMEKAGLEKPRRPGQRPPASQKPGSRRQSLDEDEED